MYDTIIVGGGPAGLTAAIYASRRALKTLVLTKDIGSQAAKTLDIENYPGVDKIGGVELTIKFKNQAECFGAEIKYENIKSIDKKDDVFVIATENNEYETKTIILAFGKSPRKLDIPGEEKFAGKGVSYCATCDGPFFRNKTVTIVGGGNSALDAALYCSKICEKVYIVHRRNVFSAEETLVEKLKATENIEPVFEDEIAEIKGGNVVEVVSLKSGKEIKTDGVFIEAGFVVDRSLVENLVKLTDNDQVKIDPMQATSVQGIFAAGDLTNTPYKQIVISAAEGAKAALSAFDYIQKSEGKRGLIADWH